MSILAQIPANDNDNEITVAKCAVCFSANIHLVVEDPARFICASCGCDITSGVMDMIFEEGMTCQP